MVAHEFYVSELKRFKKIENDHVSSAEKIKSAMDRAAENLRISREVQKEFDDFANKVQSLESNMRDETAKVATQQIMRTRLEMMLEYSRGEWQAWDVNDTIRIYNEAYPDDAFPMFAPNEVENEARSPKDVNPIDN